ncbi:MAG TPA: hypothetical protein VLJ42_06770 [Solirubrobacteraceae bacterium]|nr:hypothetical protein [Solirubrobacteraceae bacterium]
MPRSVALGVASMAALTLTLLPTAPAQAAVVSTGACDSATLTQPFARWGDANLYKLLTHGDFEGVLTGWSFTGGAQQTAGSEPFGVTGAVGASALALPAGASAQSPFTCVNASYPTFRFLARSAATASSVVAAVVYKTPIGTLTVPIGTAALSSSWQPTAPMLTGALIAGVLSGGTAQVALKFTATSGASRIDDIEIDPRMR